jgi:copper chaperone CopZ
MKSIYPSILIFLLTALSPLLATPEFEVTSPQNRQLAANKYLHGQSHQIAVHTKGLVCTSCAIGLRIHLKKLAGIDKSQFNKGTLLDASTQLIVVAYKPDAQPDLESVRKAIHKAGYEAAHYYQWDGARVRLHSFEGAE